MNTKKLSFFACFLTALSILNTACKKQYEAPGNPVDPDIKRTMTISALKALHATTGTYDVITTNDTISGVVIANDISGNLYKQIYVRDSTGAICILLEANGLYASYPVGKRLFIPVKGLCLSDYNGLIQLGIKNVSNGTVSLENIPEPIIPNYLIGGSLGNDASPKVVTATNLNVGSNTTTAMQNPLVGDLITLKDYEFLPSDTLRSLGDTSAAKSALSSQTFIKNCASNTSIIVQTSGYSQIASAKPPTGNGDITAIFTIYRTTPQLVVRDWNDLSKMNGSRCNIYEEDFQTYTRDLTNCANQKGWKSYRESGDICFVFNKLTSGATFPQASAFNSTLYTGTALNTDIKSWLVSPAIYIPTTATARYFYDITERYSQGTVKILISTNYDGVSETPWNATWTEINSILSTSSGFTNKSYSFDLSSYKGQTVYLGFKYDAPTGSIKNNVATYQPDNIRITGK